MTFAAVFCLSLATLAYELCITRVFSVVHWDALAFLAISIAMFGSAAAGVAFTLARRHGARSAAASPVRLAAMCLGCTAGIVGSFLAVSRLPLDWLRFTVDAAQPFWLLAVYLASSVPFFACGLLTCTAYADRPEASGWIAASSLAGSATGAVLPAALLPALGEGGTVAAAALAALAPCLLVPFTTGLRSGGRGRDTAGGGRAAAIAGTAAAAALAIVAAMAWPGSTLRSIRPSPYKALPQLQQVPGTRVTAASTGLRGRLETVESPSLRFAPGLSLSFRGALPRQAGLYLDGDALTVLHDLGGPGVAFARATHAYAGYLLAPSAPSCLVVQAGGGLGVACALAAGAREITVACGHPGISEAMNRWYAGRGVRALADNPRSLLARTGTSWDVIQLESWGPSIPGMAGLAEEALLTREALLACWNRLSRRGVLVISRRLLVPPSDAIRVFATAVQALGAAGIAEPSTHLAVVRSWDSCSLIASREPIVGDRLAGLRAFADALGFDLDWFWGMHWEDADRFGRFARPLFYEAYRAVLDDPSWPASQPLDVRPQGDGRPFPNRFVRWTRLGEFLSRAGGRSALLLAPELVAAAALAIAAVLGALLVAAAAASGARRPDRRFPSGLGVRAGPRNGPPPPPLILFALLGAAFMLTEIGVVDAFTVLFASPPVALSLVLGGMLAAAAVGGLCTRFLGRRALRVALAGSAASLVALAALLLPGLHLLLPLDAAPRAAAALALVAVPSVGLGMGFPLAMRDLGATPAGRALAWAANGAASVVASVAAALVAAAWGIPVLLYAAAASYALALVASSARAPRLSGGLTERAWPSTRRGRGR